MQNVMANGDTVLLPIDRILHDAKYQKPQNRMVGVLVESLTLKPYTQCSGECRMSLVYSMETNQDHGAKPEGRPIKEPFIRNPYSSLIAGGSPL